MFRVEPIACLKDNYAYLVVCDETREAAIVDPSEAPPVILAVERAGVKLVAIWNTHHHFDHVGGNEAVADRFGVRGVFGHASDKGRIPRQTQFLETDDVVTIGKVSAKITHVPGHTLGAIAYFVNAAGAPPAVFTGDTLFLAGCGRLFEGTPAQMQTSMEFFSTLPGETRVFCGHEYTQSNLRFAAHVEPSNGDVAGAAKSAEATRGQGSPTVPGTIARELDTNPFMRVRSAEIRRTLRIAADASDADALGAIRAAKDSF
jgi:hydroxyacylglutathione hydrolase